LVQEESVKRDPGQLKGQVRRRGGPDRRRRRAVPRSVVAHLAMSLDGFVADGGVTHLR
jgi:hypothetical protein